VLVHFFPSDFSPEYHVRNFMPYLILVSFIVISGQLSDSIEHPVGSIFPLFGKARKCINYSGLVKQSIEILFFQPTVKFSFTGIKSQSHSFC